MCSVLAPTTGVHVSPRVYPSLVNIKKAKHLNIGRFVITIIRKALNNDGDKEQVMPCMLYLMVKYVDSLQLQDMDVSDEGTRVAMWTNSMIKEAIKQDRATGHSAQHPYAQR
uniref:Uncharacterized protein n=1 Tax=Avena sativa TaxID=4498 RepID=A0ACD5VRE3_AVESA